MNPPTAPQPKPSTESCSPVRPKVRICIAVPPIDRRHPTPGDGACGAISAFEIQRAAPRVPCASRSAASQPAEPALAAAIRRRGRITADHRAKGSEEFAGELPGRRIDQALAELRQLAADLGVDVVMQDRDLGA